MRLHHALFISTLLTAHVVHANCLHGTSLLRREIQGGRVKVSNFGYTGLQGPLNWAGLSVENSACASSSVQSPINIDESIRLARIAPRITIENVEEAEFENLGTTVEVVINGTTVVGDNAFNLKQFHFHTPSEHRISEKYFPLEVHMVHEAADGSGGIAVLAVMFELTIDGTTTDLLTAVTQNLPDIIEPGTVTKTGPLEFGPLIQHLQTKPLFQYTGSLTTPPCAEGLTFFVTEEPLPMNVKTYLAIKDVVKFNSRYTQNGLGQDNLLRVALETVAVGAGNETDPTVLGGEGDNLDPVVIGGEGDNLDPIVIGGEGDNLDPIVIGGVGDSPDPIVLGGEGDNLDPIVLGGETEKPDPIVLGGEARKPDPIILGGDAGNPDPIVAGGKEGETVEINLNEKTSPGLEGAQQPAPKPASVGYSRRMSRRRRVLSARA